MTGDEPNQSKSDVGESRRRFQAVFNSPDSFIGVLDPDGTLREANQAALEFVDASPEDVEGRPFWDTPWWTHSDHLQDRLRDWIEQAATGDYVRFEATHLSSDGDEVTVDGIIRPVTDAKGDIVSLIAEGRDISERKRFEERLKAIDDATHRLLTADTRTEVGDIIVEVADKALHQPLTAIWRYDADADRLEPLAAADAAVDIDTSSEAAGEIGAIPAGTTEMDLFRTGEITVIRDYRTVDAPAHPDTPLRTLLVAPLDGHGQLHIGSRKVEEFEADTLELIEILARNATGALERVERERTLSKLHDVTRELMRATSREEVASLAVEAGRDILGLPYTHVYLLDAEGRTLQPVAASEDMHDQFGDLPEFSSGEGVLWDAFDSGNVVLHNDVSSEGSKQSDLPFRGAVIVPLGDYGVFGSGSLQPAEFDAFDRELASILGAETEAAFEAVERERTVREREAELARQNERLEEFTSVVSHDLRNPLNVATGRLALAQEDCESEHLDVAVGALERMDALIEGTLSLARQGQSIDEPSVTDLADVVTEAWESTEMFDATLNSADDLGTVESDADRLQELFENLFRNAVEHGGKDVTVTVGRLDDGFFVEDDGPGIPEDNRNEIFDHGYTTQTSGMGLGLAIVKRIAEAHGWSVNVTESAEHGARFEFFEVD